MTYTAGSRSDHTPVDDLPPALNPDLDRARFAEEFARIGRVHIPDIFTQRSALRLHQALERETPWGLIFNEGKKVRELATVSAEEQQAQAIAAWERAHS